MGEDGTIDIDAVFNNWLTKVSMIRQICPYSKIIVSPVMPTKIRALNSRAEQFNKLLFSCVINGFWHCLNFNSFVGPDGLLDNNYGRYFNVTLGRRDRIHLGRLGISRLTLLIREAVLQPRQVVNTRSYSSVAASRIFPSNNLGNT